MTYAELNGQAKQLWQSYWQQVKTDLPLSNTFEAQFWATYEPLIQQRQAVSAQKDFSLNTQETQPTTLCIQDVLMTRFYQSWHTPFEAKRIFYDNKTVNAGEIVLRGCVVMLLTGGLVVGSLIAAFTGFFQALIFTLPTVTALVLWWWVEKPTQLHDANDYDYDYDKPPQKTVFISLNHYALKVTEVDHTNRQVTRELKYENVQNMWRVEDGFLVSGREQGQIIELKVPSGFSAFNEVLSFISDIVSYNYLRKQ
ncbi:hypothetical protein [uncultured Microscilla sp.]|uniref:hypothetical protein n=1 Tax=uncultured Microscilla sp. TaxID=432653 RepID=UPI0026307D3A|nr:hypothetical protein [uncultured Microscilla sp.]